MATPSDTLDACREMTRTGARCVLAPGHAGHHHAESLADWLEEWDREGGWRAHKQEVQRLVDEIEHLRLLVKFLDGAGKSEWVPWCGRCGGSLYNHDCYPGSTDGLLSPETPVERPESPSEPPAATGQPEDGSGPQGDRPCMACGHSYEAHSFPWPGTHEVCTWKHCTCKGFR